MITRALVFTCATAAMLSLAVLGSSRSSAGPTSGNIRPLRILQPMGPHGQLGRAGFEVGKVLHTADGGQVFGFDVDQNGNDGLLASAQTISPQGQVLASVETFDQTTAKIAKVVVTTRTMDDFVTYGIVGDDVGLVLHEHVVNNRNIRTFRILAPVTSNMFTGKWTPPNGSNFLLQRVASNQSTAKSAIFATDLSGNPFVFSSMIASNTFGPVFDLDPGHFGGADQPQMAQDIAHNRAVFATSPDAGAVGGQEPLIATVNLSNGNMREFNGVIIPPFHSGFVNGLAVDSSTGIACTTTELDADVEFYDLARETGFFVQLPGANGGQSFSGEAVASDPIHHLFLVAQPNGSIGPPGDSVVDIFDENGNVVESITGIKAFGITPGLAINPAKRVGFIDGPTADAITRFTY
ncbi:MAG TPA: hypothetical protein VII69_07845 [Candidatus Eremiobacteraceae bacterium]